MSNKQTFVEKVLSFVKGGDVSKLSRFETKLNKYIAKQISQREDEIENLTDKITDAKETLSDTILNVNLDQIQTTDGAEAYCETYIDNLLENQNSINDIQSEIDTKNDEIAEFKAIMKTIAAVEGVSEEAK